MKASVGIGAVTALALAAVIPVNQVSVQHAARTAHHQAAAAPVHAQLTAYSGITAGSVRSHRAHLAHRARLAYRAHRGLSHHAYYGRRPAAALGSSLGSFRQCVIQRESGGNSQVMNSTGHYGLYQFAYGTWVAYGGSPSAFGHASAAQQDQVFANAMATPGGASNWRSYDGC